MVQFLIDGTLPDDPQHPRKVTAQAHSFTIVDNIIYNLDSTKKVCQQVMEKYYSGLLIRPLFCREDTGSGKVCVLMYLTTVLPVHSVLPLHSVLLFTLLAKSSSHLSNPS